MTLVHRQLACLMALPGVVGAAAPGALAAQQSAGVVIGAAPFLTRDRGWNFENNVSLSAGGEWGTRRGGVRALTTLRLGRRGPYGYDASYPPRAGSTENGVTVATHAMVRGGPAYLFVGPERFQVAWQTGPVPARGGTWVLATGLGVRRGAWSVEGRYGMFARRLGTTRGHLDLGILWRGSRDTRSG
jgi:hypothetical protein